MHRAWLGRAWYRWVGHEDYFLYEWDQFAETLAGPSRTWRLASFGN